MIKIVVNLNWGKCMRFSHIQKILNNGLSIFEVCLKFILSLFDYVF